MWICKGFLTYLTIIIGGMNAHKTYEIGAYSDGYECEKKGESWVKKHSKTGIQADYSCEKESINREVI